MSNISIEELEDQIRILEETSVMGESDAFALKALCWLLAFEKASQDPVAYLYSASFERGHVEGEIEDAPGCDMPVYAAPQPQPVPYNLPAGWMMVPIEPTEDMVIEGFESEPDAFFSDSVAWEAYQAMSGCEQAAHKAKLCWAAMIAAAPKPEKCHK